MGRQHFLCKKILKDYYLNISLFPSKDLPSSIATAEWEVPQLYKLLSSHLSPFTTISGANIPAASRLSTNSLCLQGNDHRYRPDESPKPAFLLFLSTAVLWKTKQTTKQRPHHNNLLFSCPPPLLAPVQCSALRLSRQSSFLPCFINQHNNHLLTLWNETYTRTHWWEQLIAMRKWPAHSCFVARCNISRIRESRWSAKCYLSWHCLGSSPG